MNGFKLFELKLLLGCFKLLDGFSGFGDEGGGHDFWVVVEVSLRCTHHLGIHRSRR